MAENQLRVGEPRLCRLIDGNPDTPETTVMLRNTGNSIEVTFPISGGMFGKGDGPYDRWWSSNVTYGDDPERTKYSYAPPPVMMVYDDAGFVVLVGCHATGGARRSFIAGKGIVVVDYAVLGGKNLKYDKINGMRTDSAAYRRWMGGSSITLGPTHDEKHLLRSLNIGLEKHGDIKVSRKLNMSARGDWRVTPVLGGYDVRESLTFRTLVTKPRSWSEHLDRHIDVLDLVSIAAWRNCSFQSIDVHRTDDPIKAVSGDRLSEQWSEVVSHRLPGGDLTDCDGRFLFSYGDMDRGGINTWLRLREDYGRALDYLLRILRSGHTWSPRSAIMSGIALEQLGYLIEVKRNGRSRLNGRGRLSFKNALDAVLSDMEAFPIDQNEVVGWKNRCRNVYMGAKHGDRDEVDHLTMLNTHRENLLVLRYWVAQRLGVSGKVLESNLVRDPLRSGFVSKAEPL